MLVKLHNEHIFFSEYYNNPGSREAAAKQISISIIPFVHNLLCLQITGLVFNFFFVVSMQAAVVRQEPQIMKKRSIACPQAQKVK